MWLTMIVQLFVQFGTYISFFCETSFTSVLSVSDLEGGSIM